MTEQYNQSDINLLDASPLSFSTPDDSPVSILIDTLTGDGQSLVVNLTGGGSDPSAVNTNDYLLGAGVAGGIFTREAGVGFIQPGALTLITNGLAFAASLTFVDLPAPILATQCFLTITPPGGAPLYNHRFKVSKIRF